MSKSGIILSVILLLLSGCMKEPETIVVCLPEAEDASGAWESVISKFEAANPNLRIHLVEKQVSLQNRGYQYVAKLLADEPSYDLIYLNGAWIAKFAEAGLLTALDDQFTPEMRENYLSGEIQASVYKGRIWRIPVWTDCGVLYYRKDLLEAAHLNPPETFAGLIEISQRLQSPPELWGFVFTGRESDGLGYLFLEILRGFGGDVIGPDNTCLLESPESLTALVWMRDAIFRSRVIPQAVRTFDETAMLDYFLSGKSVFMRDRPYAWMRCQDSASAIRGKVGIIPMAHAPEESSSATLQGWGFSIPKRGRHKAGAWKFASYAASSEGAKILVMKQGIMPSLKSLYKDADVLSLNPHFPELYKVLAHAEPGPVNPRYPEINNVIQRHVSLVIKNAETPEQAARAATEEINYILAEPVRR
jgi:multiple sugar transport system substrate-binding protein